MDRREFGPARAELVVRRVFAACGLAVLLATAALVDPFGLAALVLAGAIVWAARRQILRAHP